MASFFSFVCMPLSVYVWALVTCAYWEWFVVPVGAPALPLGSAAGAMMFVSAMKCSIHSLRSYDELPENEQMAWTVVQDFVLPGVAWLCGIIIHAVAF